MGSTSPSRHDQLVESFRDRAAGFRDGAHTIGRTAAWVSWLRLAAGLGAVACFVLALAGWGLRAPLALSLFLVGVVLFAGLVAYHDRLKARIMDLTTRAQLNEWAAHRVERNWSQLPPVPDHASTPVGADHAYASDLDLFGPASIGRLLPPMTALGFRTVREWLLALPPRDVTEARQEAVAELRGFGELRETFAVQAGGRLGAAPGRGEAIEAWAARAAPSAIPAWMLIAAAVLLVAAGILGIAQATGAVSGFWWIVPLAMGRVLTSSVAKVADETIQSLMRGVDTLAAWMGVARAVGSQEFQAKLLRAFQDDLGTGDGAAWRQIRSLRRLADWAAVRESPLMHFALRWALFWDLWIAWIASGWQARNGPRVPAWMSAIGACESLGALATLAEENPDWTFPVFLESAPAMFEARAIGHPVLPVTARVGNDVSIGPEGTLLLVTGSNMAGKSTFLRAIAINTVLARVGSTVCASSLATSPFRVWTVMRIEDSLERGVSYFMAELERLKEVVQAARSDEGPLLYVFDEILQGTNSAERLIAARCVLQHLMTARAVGVVATHDLSLADAGVFEGRVRHLHFQEQLNGAGMTFDYRARPGKATSTNALKLLELVGLGD